MLAGAPHRLHPALSPQYRTRRKNPPHEPVPFRTRRQPAYWSRGFRLPRRDQGCPRHRSPRIRRPKRRRPSAVSSGQQLFVDSRRRGLSGWSNRVDDGGTLGVSETARHAGFRADRSAVSAPQGQPQPARHATRIELCRPLRVPARCGCVAVGWRRGRSTHGCPTPRHCRIRRTAPCADRHQPACQQREGKRRPEPLVRAPPRCPGEHRQWQVLLGSRADPLEFGTGPSSQTGRSANKGCAQCPVHRPRPKRRILACIQRRRSHREGAGVQGQSGCWRDRPEGAAVVLE